MSSQWLTAFLEAGGDALVVTLPTHVKNAKNTKSIRPQPEKLNFGNSGNFGTITNENEKVVYLKNYHRKK